MPDYRNNFEINKPREDKENKEIEYILSPEQGATLGSVVMGQLQQVQKAKDDLKDEEDRENEELLRLGHAGEASVLKTESAKILNEAEKAGEEYINTLRKDIPDLDDKIDCTGNRS